MFKNLKFIRKTMKKKSAEVFSEGDHTIEYIKAWVDGLVLTLKNSSDDKEFVMDLLESSGENFTNSFSEIDKENVFLYILGMLARTKGTN